MKSIHLVQKDKKILIDDEDFEFLSKFKWRLQQGYAVRDDNSNGWRNKKTILMHRVIVNTPKGMDTDHINGNKLDNRKENLRICTRQQNNINRPKIKRNSNFLYKGVQKAGSKYYAVIYSNHKRYHAGLFDTIHQAALAYDLFIDKLHGEFANRNFEKVIDG